MGWVPVDSAAPFHVACCIYVTRSCFEFLRFATQPAHKMLQRAKIGLPCIVRIQSPHSRAHQVDWLLDPHRSNLKTRRRIDGLKIRVDKDFQFVSA